MPRGQQPPKLGEPGVVADQDSDLAIIRIEDLELLAAPEPPLELLVRGRMDLVLEVPAAVAAAQEQDAAQLQPVMQIGAFEEDGILSSR